MVGLFTLIVKGIGRYEEKNPALRVLEDASFWGFVKEGM